MLDRLPAEIVCYIASYARTAHNGISLRIGNPSFVTGNGIVTHKLIVLVAIDDERVHRCMVRCIKSAVPSHASLSSAASKEGHMTYTSPNEFDLLDILLSIHLPRLASACNWCYNPSRKMVSLGVEEVLCTCSL